MEKEMHDKDVEKNYLFKKLRKIHINNVKIFN